jgi:hypothetical protein
MPIWLLLAGVAFWALVFYIGAHGSRAKTPSEKKAWNIAGACLFGGGLVALFLTT